MNSDSCVQDSGVSTR